MNGRPVQATAQTVAGLEAMRRQAFDLSQLAKRVTNVEARTVGVRGSFVVFAASGTFSTDSYAWLRAVVVEVFGGGGGAGGCATSGAGIAASATGAGGGYSRKRIEI